MAKCFVYIAFIDIDFVNCSLRTECFNDGISAFNKLISDRMFGFFCISPFHNRIILSQREGFLKIIFCNLQIFYGNLGQEIVL